MASFWNITSRFGRSLNRGNNSPRNPSPNPGNPTSPNPSSGLPSPSPNQLSTPTIPPVPQSPSVAANMAPEQASSPNLDHPPAGRKPPFFFREENSNIIVKGNFMTLAAKPAQVDEGEWLAHQVVEQYRLLEGMIRVVMEPDSKTKVALCNPKTCPTMSAAEFTYTWLDNNRNPVRIPAPQYIQLVQKWILHKINDPAIFPTDINKNSEFVNLPLNQEPNEEWLGKLSGFPQSFETDVKSLYRQMFRCYAHLYHGHWLEPFYHLGAYKELNTCFIHFVNVGKLYNLLHERDLKPMQPLLDIWQSKGLMPASQGQAQKQEGLSTGA